VDNTSETASYWSRPINELFEALHSSRGGLNTSTATQRLQQYGRNTLAADHGCTKALRLFLDRFQSPLMLVLFFAAVVALIVHDWLDALIVPGNCVYYRGAQFYPRVPRHPCS
jgi:Mg2+-importing ATPase